MDIDDVLWDPLAIKVYTEAERKFFNDRNTEEFVTKIANHFSPGEAKVLFEFSLFLFLCRGFLESADLMNNMGIRIPSCPAFEGGAVIDLLTQSGDRPNPKSLEWLILHDYPINGEYFGCMKPLHVAASRGYLDIAKVLVKQGVDIDEKTVVDGGNTPLMFAVKGGHLEFVSWLLEQGADCSRRNKECGQTAEEMATKEMKLLFSAHFSEVDQAVPDDD